MGHPRNGPPPGPSSEPSPTPRTTDEPESRTSSGRTTLAPTSPETDREALVALYNATGGPNWNDNNNWLSDVPISEWEGVATDGNGRVTELYLEGNQVSGEIPPELGNLAKLKDLDLGTGEIPGVGQPRQPGTAATRGEPVERVRATAVCQAGWIWMNQT